MGMSSPRAVACVDVTYEQALSALPLLPVSAATRLCSRSPGTAVLADSQTNMSRWLTEVTTMEYALGHEVMVQAVCLAAGALGHG